MPPGTTLLQIMSKIDPQMNEPILEAIRQATIEPESLASLAQFTQHFGQLSVEEVTDLVVELVRLTENSELETRREPLDQAIQAVFQGLVQWRLQHGDLDSMVQDEWQSGLESLYLWAAPDSNLRNLVLSWLSTAGTEAKPYEPALRRWAEFICTDPPENRIGIQLAFGALMCRDWDPPMWLLERLLHEGIAHSQIAPAVFDLFNFYFRAGVLSRHPAADRAAELCGLVGRMGESLGVIEDGKSKFADPVQVGRQVSDSVAMVVALCDALALCEYVEAIPTLQSLLKLKHRRVQTEAAAALARLGDESGKVALIKLAEEPVCRLRVLAFAEELGFMKEVSLELRGEIARAESELAIWLSEPSQVGVAPTFVRLIDNREMVWPSYENQVQCYLFEYGYGEGDQANRNIGIAGPLTYAFPADLTGLPIEDMYALFAGWQTVHQEVFLLAVDKAAAAFPNEWMRVMRTLQDAELNAVIIHTAASFFSRLVAIASCRWMHGEDSISGTVIVDQEHVSRVPEGNKDAPIDWELAFCLWRGKQLLNTFNTSE